MKVISHNVVYKEQGRYAGWPANHGLWRNGDKIIVGFEIGKMNLEGGFHAIDRYATIQSVVAVSEDGETWSNWLPTWLAHKDTNPDPIDFHTQQVKFRMTSPSTGPSFMYVAEGDGTQTWVQGCRLPLFKRHGMAARTSYLTNGDKHSCLAFWSASKLSDSREGQPLCAFTDDGGVTWKHRSWIDDVPPGGFGIMPSAIRRENGDIICAVRWRERHSIGRKYGAAGNPFQSGIICYVSSDESETWKHLSIPIRGLSNAGNPPDMLQLSDGGLVLVYGWRDPPFCMVAQISKDGGRTWGEPESLRENGGCHDLGYSRSTVRSDGSIVTVYYWNDSAESERYIASTIWEA